MIDVARSHPNPVSNPAGSLSTGISTSPEVAVVAYNAGNVKSMQFALERLGAKVILTDNPDVIRNAPRVVFPGVGEASYAMEQLKQRGLVKVLQSLEQPFLGVCLGMQLMCESSEEGNTKGLGIFDSSVVRFQQVDDTCNTTGDGKGRSIGAKRIEKIPHMGWNTLQPASSKAVDNQPTESETMGTQSAASAPSLLQGIPDDACFYFVHSFYATLSGHTAAETKHIIPFSSMLYRDNYYGVQFHPEKSGAPGSKLLANFLTLHAAPQQ